eukprot:gene11177-3998_t
MNEENENLPQEEEEQVEYLVVQINDFEDEGKAILQIGNFVFEGKLEDKATRTFMAFEGDEYKFKTNKIINMNRITKMTEK